MAANNDSVPLATPNKRKRKTELERLLENDNSNAGKIPADSDGNPWTPRENLEVLRIHRDYHSTNNAKQNAARLHDMMSRIRRTAFEAQKPARTDKEFMSQVRQLQKEGVMIDDLEKELFPPEETPRKRRKGKKTD